ncbi:hypothetical protein GOBAR_AA18889 [Gossypium barbadense]|uniref:Uncharacterized protein n=1 Tax=Gossypium barbadense TaxID=3634 RepID=A0A2P5XEK7_GOSBA|nr:hypothetical protein GOBAR_AA18889 [Gossypium barbadense]
MVIDKGILSVELKKPVKGGSVLGRWGVKGYNIKRLSEIHFWATWEWWWSKVRAIGLYSKSLNISLLSSVLSPW